MTRLQLSESRRSSNNIESAFGKMTADFILRAQKTLVESGPEMGLSVSH